MDGERSASQNLAKLKKKRFAKTPLRQNPGRGSISWLIHRDLVAYLTLPVPTKAYAVGGI